LGREIDREPVQEQALSQSRHFGYGRLLTFDSDWKLPLGEALKGALKAVEAVAPLDLGCVAAHGIFMRERGGTMVVPSGRAATAFLLELIARLQTSATVLIIDVRAYSGFLNGSTSMKFRLGDETDKAICVALKHEFLRCDEAFHQFAAAATILISKGDDRRLAYNTYNAYARFIHHLYEFALCGIDRDRNDTDKLLAVDADRYLASYLQRSFEKTARRDSGRDRTDLGKSHQRVSRSDPGDIGF
jgi:hypothetical protein